MWLDRAGCLQVSTRVSQFVHLVDLTGSKGGQVGPVVYKHLLESGQCVHLIDLTGSKGSQVGPVVQTASGQVKCPDSKTGHT